MKTYKLLLGAAIVAAASVSCTDDNADLVAGEGRLAVQATINSDVTVVSRATLEEELGETFMLWISNSKGVVRKYDGLANIPAEGIVLPSGSYVAEAWAGDSVSASWDKRWFKCYEPFEITKGQTTALNLNCKIANVVVSLNYDPSVDDVLTDYTFTVSHDRGMLEFVPGVTPNRAYFMMPSTDTDLAYTLSGKKKSDGTVFTRTGVIANAQSAHEYAITVSAVKEFENPGGGFLDIVVDDSEITVDQSVVITLAPLVNGVGFNIANEQFYTGEEGHISIYASAATSIKSAIISSTVLPTMFPAIVGGDFDYMYLRDNNTEVLSDLDAAGLKFTYNHDTATDLSNLKINFEENFLDALPSGTSTFQIAITDNYDKTTTRALTVTVSHDPIVPNNIASVAGGAFAKYCTVTARVVDASAIDLSSSYVEYRVSDNQSRADWAQAPVYIDGGLLKADLADLTPETVYDYRFVVGEFTTPVDTFVTEGTYTLPNGSFEEYQDQTPMLFYAQGQGMFWDSGNHGSATMSKNVTIVDTQYKVEGNQSLKLCSQFVGVGRIGKFAAGNIFAGKYLGTDGTDGILGWGRPITSRPKALKGYVRYEPGTVNYTNAGAPDIVNGQPDKGIIYIGILDNSIMKTYNSDQFPVIIKTKSTERQLFSGTDSNVIGYGQLVLEGNIGGDGMVEFQIPITYTKQGVPAAHIVIVASASKGGDYFAGGNSNMWLDALELVY